MTNRPGESRAFKEHTGAKSGRFDGVGRDYLMKDVKKLSGSVPIEHSPARHGANKLWDSLHTKDYVHSLGAMSGNQAMQMVRGWFESNLSVRLAGRC